MIKLVTNGRMDFRGSGMLGKAIESIFVFYFLLFLYY